MTRSRNSLNRRIERLASARSLTDHEAVELLGDDVTGTLSAPVEWNVRSATDGTPIGVWFEVPVFTSKGVTLSLFGRIALARPDKSHWMLFWGDPANGQHRANLRRLDLRDTHRNPDGEFWDGRTHKHLWSEAVDNQVAYTPTDIPHDQSTKFDGSDDYRAVFEAFVTECKIGLGPDYKWSDPPELLGRQALPNWEVP